jgi:hypothetical protein
LELRAAIAPPAMERVHMTFQSNPAGLLAGTALLLMSALPAAAEIRQHERAQPLPPNVSAGRCLLTGMKYSVSTDLQKTGSRQFRDVTGTAMSFTQSQTGCVEVDFTAEAATTPNELLVTEVVLDGSTACLPADNIFASDSPSSDLSAHAMSYICPSVTAGNHAIKVQFRSRFGGQVALDYRTTIVRYAQ